jgi:dihydroorotate dehydrogenase
VRPYQQLFDRVLTRTDPEKAHQLAFRAIRAARPVTRLAGGRVSKASQGRTWPVMGLDFPGLLGLAAGFDKNAVGIDALANMGFGSIEIGTVTGEPQPGNPRPRLARLPADRAIVNRMGFNNDGAEAVSRRLAARRMHRTGRRDGVPLGINIGKTKVVPDDEAVRDYEKSTSLLAPFADYLVVNVSSPNTPGLRDLQAVAQLEPLMRAVRSRADDVTDRRVPLLVKIAPDLSDEDVLAVADLALALGLDGIVATNTTISRTGLSSSPGRVEAAGGGGLSGPPLRARATEVMRLLRARVGPDMTLIGAGGITTAEDAFERLEAGADLLQGYTGFVYEGPWWPARLNARISASLQTTKSSSEKSSREKSSNDRRRDR